MMEFRAMQKIPRLSREVILTEKIDGTNASVYIGVPGELCGGLFDVFTVRTVNGARVLAGSRTRWITPEDDNFEFAKWVHEHAEELTTLGPGHHFGEWWGKGIQRNYGLEERRFSLFNVSRWYQYGVPHFQLRDPAESEAWQLAPPCCSVVPVLYRGPFDTDQVDITIYDLMNTGSRAAPGFMDPEGVVVYHTAGNLLFKKTVKGDEEGKHREGQVRKERPPQSKLAREPQIMRTGGRRKGTTIMYTGPERRTPK